jgi:hypothetical protein
MSFKLPEKKELKVYALERKDGSLIVRGEDELEETIKELEGKGGGKGK